MTPRNWSIRPSTQGGLPTSAARSSASSSRLGGDVDEALVDGQPDDFDEQGHPGRRAGRQLIEEPKTLVAARPG